jgi:hypothetical protein
VTAGRAFGSDEEHSSVVECAGRSHREGRRRLRSQRRDASFSSLSAVSAVFTDTLASMTKDSCRAFADPASHRTPAPNPYSGRPAARNASA